MAGLLEAIAKGACKAARKSKEYTDREIAKVNEKLEKASDSVADLLSYSLKGSEIGEIIVMDDVNPINVKVRAKITSETLANGTAVTVVSAGLNLWDEEWNLASLNETNGNFTETSNGNVCSKNYISVIPEKQYYNSLTCWYAFYDKNKAFISATAYSAGVFTTPSNCYFMKFQTLYYGSYKNDIIIAHSTTAVPYSPYIEGETITTAIGETVELAPIAPNMTITTDTGGAILSVEYAKDPNIVIQKFTNAFISLGGNI